MEVMDDAMEIQSADIQQVAGHARKPSLKLADPVKEALREACFKDSFSYSNK